ncbi:hypothetical protein HDA40_002046 [Hamadaea flava]|uniref:Uncharacterized protein n=1 Tax=Hamadaea flava TaxID=1742688 RepID=A0ABV8LKU5_9ACTN|nr:hypothetical protein [Hamadaea flava]MCP2323539.1 hypothetical protein [Hamadaea flava]
MRWFEQRTADSAQGAFRFLACGIGAVGLHVFVEGPLPRHFAGAVGEPTPPYHLRHLEASTEQDGVIDLFGATMGIVGHRGLQQSRELIGYDFVLPDPVPGSVGLRFFDDETGDILYSTTVVETSGPPRWTVLIEQGLCRLLGIGAGEGLLYAFAEGPYQGGRTFSFRLWRDDQPEPERGHADANAVGRSRMATRMTVAVNVALPAPQRLLRLQLIDDATGHVAYDLSAERAVI